jgi:uncharacterized membrane protein
MAEPAQEERLNQGETLSTKEIQDIESNKDVAAVSWTLIMAPILLVQRKDSPFIQHHARQAVILFVFAIIIVILPGSLSYLNIFSLAIAAIGLLNASSGSYWRAPLLYSLAEKGFTLSNIFTWLADGWRYLIRIIKQAFSSKERSSQDSPSPKATSPEDKEALNTSQDQSKLEILQRQNQDLAQKAGFLERELLKEKFFKSGLPLAKLEGEAKSQVSQALEILLKAKDKATRSSELSLIVLTNNSNEIILGSITQESLRLFINFSVNELEASYQFASWQGLELSFADPALNNKLQKISQGF